MGSEMINCKKFYELLIERGVDFFAGVPDSLLKDLLEMLYVKYASIKDNLFKIAINHNITNEDELLNEDDEVILLPAFSGG